MSVLEEIVARKRIDVAERQRRFDGNELRDQAIPTRLSLIAALRKPGFRFILECKKASPSEGLLRADYDPAAIAADYQDFADAISILTDAPFFGGALADVRAVRARVSLPILCKDFVIDPFQITEARATGADAILLMLSVLDDAHYRDCAAEAARLKMDVLTEVHDEQELKRAIALDAKLIGINNRDLHSLRVDLGTTLRLASKIPNDRVVVCESGIRSRTDLDVIGARVDGFLVGSHLMKASRLDLAVRELIYGSVKICGLRSSEQLQLAFAAGATWAGLIFAPESKRCVSPELARSMASGAPLPLVGVFVNESIERVAAIATELRLGAVQLHGEENSEMIAALRRRIHGNCQIWKAVRVNDSIPDIDQYGADRLLLDARVEGLRGGTGTSFDWSLLDDFPDKSRWIVSGGIRPDNVLAAHQLGCSMLDVNSGVESAPGVKDESLVRRLFATLRGEI